MEVFGRDPDSRPRRERDRWEPEPLELPLEPPRQRRDRGDDDHDDTGDVPGSHVVVIDIA